MADELTSANYVQKIKSMSAAERRAITAKKLIELILETDADERQKNIDQQLANIQSSMEILSNLARENKDEITMLKNENGRLEREIRTLKENENAGANEELTKEVAELRGQINEIEQYLRVNNLEFVGLPPPAVGEEEEDVIIKACNALNGLSAPVRKEDIDISHPLKSERRDGKPVHIARFISRKVKYAVLAAKKSEENRQFKFRDQDVFINEHLSKINRGLFAKANERKRTLEYKYLWTKNGVVNMRKADNSEIIRITKESDFLKL